MMKTVEELIEEIEAAKAKIEAAEAKIDKGIDRVCAKYPEWLICYHNHTRCFSAWLVVDEPECSGSFGADWEIQSTGQYHRDDLQEIIDELKAQEV